MIPPPPGRSAGPVWLVRLVLAGAALALPGGGVQAQTTQPARPVADWITLTPAPLQPAAAPYAEAVLSVRVGRVDMVQAVRLREVQGGPTVLVPFILTPGASQSVTVRLPALSQQQTYEVALLRQERADAEVEDVAKVNIAWPADLSAPDMLLAPQEFEKVQDLPRWDAALVRNLVLALAAFVVACGGLLLVSRPVGRLALLVVLTAAALGGVWLLARGQNLVVQREVQKRSSRLVVLTARRTVQWETPEILWPVYYSPRQMREDSLLIHIGKGSSLRLDPQDVRILRQMP